MKSSVLNPNESFQPITLSVVIESEEELNWLLDMLGRNVSIPEMVNPRNLGLGLDIMRNIRSALQEAKK